MTVQAAAALAQILPALLAIGLLAPVLSGVKFLWRQRRHTLFQSIGVLVSELVLIYSIVLEFPLPFWMSLFIIVTIVWSLMGVGVVVYEWAKLDSKETQERDFDKMLSRKIRKSMLELLQDIGPALRLRAKLIAITIRLQALKIKTYRLEQILIKRGQPLPPRPPILDSPPPEQSEP